MSGGRAAASGHPGPGPASAPCHRAAPALAPQTNPADGYKAWLPEYEPRPGQAAKWPSSGLFAAAWALRRAQRPHRVALLGFRVSEYNGTGSDFGHNAESEERLYHAWAEQGLLTRINE